MPLKGNKRIWECKVLLVQLPYWNILHALISLHRSTYAMWIILQRELVPYIKASPGQMASGNPSKNQKRWYSRIPQNGMTMGQPEIDRNLPVSELSSWERNARQREEGKQWDCPFLITHQWAELHNQQVGCHLCTLGQTLQEVGMLECPGGERE